MADLKKRSVRVSVKGKFGPTHRGSTSSSSPYEKSPGIQKARNDSSNTKRRDMVASPGPHSKTPSPTVHSPISNEDEPTPGTEIQPEVTPTFADQDILPDFAKSEETQEENPATEVLSRTKDDDSASKEVQATTSDGQASAQNSKESSLSQDDDEEGSRSSTNLNYVKNIKSRLSNRKKYLMASAALSIAGVVTAVIIALPGFLIHQVKDLLLGKLGDMSSRQQIRYRRTKLARFSDAFSRDGRVGGKMINEMEGRGYTFRFEDPVDKNKVTGLATPNGTVLSAESGDAAAHISDYMDQRHPLRTSRWKTRRMTAFTNRYGLSVIPPTVRLPDSPEDPDSALNKNMANQTDVDEVETRGLKEKLPDDATEQEVTDQNASAKAAENSDIFDANRQSLKETGEVVDPDALRLSELVPDGTDPDLLSAAKNLAETGGSVGGKALDSLESLTVSGLTDRVCTIKNRLRASITASRSFKALAAMKQALQPVNVTDGIKLKKSDSKLFSSYMKRFTSLDRNGVPIGGSVGFSYILKGKFSKSKNNATRGRAATDGRLTGTMGGVWNAVDLPLTSAADCGKWQNPLSQIGLGIIEVAVGFFSGSSSKLITEGAKRTALQVIKESIQQATVKTIAKSIGKNLLKTAAVEMSFEGAMMLAQWYAEKTLNDNFSSLEEGGMMFDIQTSGGGVARKQRDLQAGFVPATTVQYGQAYEKYLAEVKEENSHKSVFARIFDPRQTGSLVNSVAWQTPLSIASAGSSLSSQVASFSTKPASLLSSVASILGGKASAASSDDIAFETYQLEGDGALAGQELATDPYGNLQTILRQDIVDVDETENEAFLRQNNYIDEEGQPIGTFKEHVENCVYQIDTISVLEGGDPNNSAEDCMATQQLTVRFKAHLAHLDMTDGVEAKFIPEEISDGTGEVEETPSTTGGPTTPVDCSNVSGNAKIVCAAEKYMGIRYANSNPKWATEWGTLNTNGRLNGGASAANWLQTRVPNGYGDFLDCSGYTNLALYDAFNYQTTAGCSGYYARDTNNDGLSDADNNLKIIPIAQARPGDFLTISLDCNGDTAGHIGIFAGVLPSGQWSTLESSAGRNVNGEKKSGYYAKPPGGGTGEHDFKYAVRYIGPGSGP